MNTPKDKIVDFFRDQIIKKNGQISKNDIDEIIYAFENKYPYRDGRTYWNNYSKHIIKHWERNGDHPDDLKNLKQSLGYDENEPDNRPPDEGLPIKSKNEKEFTEKHVVPYLESKGHKITACNENRRDQFNSDIESEKDGVIYYTEVKKDLGNHHLQTAIGQIFYQILDNEDTEGDVKYQIAIPEQYKGNRHFLYEFERRLYERLKIAIIFVKG